MKHTDYLALNDRIAVSGEPDNMYKEHVVDYLKHLLAGLMKIMKPLSLLSFLRGATVPSGPGSPHFRGFMITLRHNTFGRAPLGE